MSKPLVKTKRQLIILDFLLILVGLVTPLLSQWMLEYLPECGFQQLGMTCPTCGGTRCVAAFFRFDFAASFSYHPVFFLIIIYIIVSVILLHANVLMSNSRLNRVTRMIVHTRMVIVWAVVIMAFGGVRMAIHIM